MVCIRNVIALSIVSAILSGCMNVAMSGAQVAYNHHGLEQNFKDQYATLEAAQKINSQDRRFKDTNISVSTFHGQALLTGQAPKPKQREEAEKIVKAIPNVQEVYNLIEVTNPSSTLVRISDAWITTKVKAKLIASDDVDVTQVKVVTENGIVYLMGILPPDQAMAAVDLARTTDGVAGVVKVFSYIKISKTM